MVHEDPQFDIVRTADGFLAAKIRRDGKESKDALKKKEAPKTTPVIEPDVKTEDDVLAEQASKLEAYSIAELKTIADENSIPVLAKAKKEEIIKTLVDAGVFVEE
jgi:hypothetical protein